MDADERIERLGRIAWAAGILMPDCKLQRTVARIASRSVTLPAFGVVMGVLLLGGLVLAVRYVFGRREHGLYRGTVARSLIPVFAAAAIAIGVLAHPVLRASEVRLLRADSSLSASTGPISFTRAEALLVERLKAQVTQAARDLDSDT